MQYAVLIWNKTGKNAKGDSMGLYHSTGVLEISIAISILNGFPLPASLRAFFDLFQETINDRIVDNHILMCVCE